MLHTDTVQRDPEATQTIKKNNCNTQPTSVLFSLQPSEGEGRDVKTEFLLLSSSFSITGNTNNRGKQLLMQRIIVTPWRFIIIRLMMLFVI